MRVAIFIGVFLLLISLVVATQQQNKSTTNSVELTQKLIPSNMKQEDFKTRVTALINSKKKELKDINEGLKTTSILSTVVGAIGSNVEMKSSYIANSEKTLSNLRSVKEVLEYEIETLEKICLTGTCTAKTVDAPAIVTQTTATKAPVVVEPPKDISAGCTSQKPSKLVTLFRFYNHGKVDHLYAIDPQLKQQYTKEGYAYEGEQCTLLEKKVDGSVPLYQFRSSSDSVITIKKEDFQNKAGWTFIGVLGHCLKTEQPGTQKLHRYYNTAHRNHFHTTTWEELRQGAQGYTYQGVECYVYPAGMKNTCV